MRVSLRVCVCVCFGKKADPALYLPPMKLSLITSLCLQALLMKEYTLSIILLTRSLMMASSHHSHSESLESSNGDNGDKGSRSAEPVNSARCIVFAMVGILAHAQEFPNALSKCVLPAVERYCRVLCV